MYNQHETQKSICWKEERMVWTYHILRPVWTFHHHQIEELTLLDLRLGREASVQCARGVFTMTKLRALKLYSVRLDDEFFSVMPESASQSQVDLTLLSLSLSCIQCVSNTCIRLPMWENIQRQKKLITYSGCCSLKSTL